MDFARCTRSSRSLRGLSESNEGTVFFTSRRSFFGDSFRSSSCGHAHLEAV